MMTTPSPNISTKPTRADFLRLYFSKFLDKPLPQNEETAEFYAQVIAAMYGPALKELEKH